MSVKQTSQLVIPSYLKLTDDQLEKLHQLHKLVDDPENPFLTVPCLCRYLRARNYNVEKAYKMLTETIKWRKEFKPELFGPDSEVVKRGKKNKDFYMIGKTKLGQPICYMTPNANVDENPNSEKIPDEGLKWLAYILEEGIRRMGPGVETMVLIVDLRNYGIRANSSGGKDEIMKCINMLMNHYPERLGKFFICDHPWWFNVIWWFVYPFLSNETVQKVHFVSGDLENKRKELGKYIDLEQLSTEFGGKLKISERMKETWEMDNNKNEKDQ